MKGESKQMRIVAFLQNQWFKDPEGIKAMCAENPERRERYIAAFLFMGCLTGKRLQQVFGKDLCDAIVWEEASAEVGGHSRSLFAADRQHMMSVINKHKPTVILSFGKIASEGVRSLPIEIPIIYGPHPAARQNAIEGLRAMRQELEPFKEYR
jgi:hypothetical protein